MNSYEIVNTYPYLENYTYLKDVIEKTLKIEHVKNAIFSILFVDEKTIQHLNKTYRNVDRVTDVISFALEDGEKNNPLPVRPLGDIYICIPRMKEQAIEYGHSEKRELSFLVVHGLLHLLGYDHMEKEEEQKMFSLQEKILASCKIFRD